MNGPANQLVVAALTIASGPVFWGFLQWLISRKGEKAKAAKQQQADEKASAQAEIDKAALLAEAQRTAQRTALESADRAISSVQAECDKCSRRLDKVEQVCENLIVASEAQLAADTPENRATCTAAIWAARRAI